MNDKEIIKKVENDFHQGDGTFDDLRNSMGGVYNVSVEEYETLMKKAMVEARLDERNRIIATKPTGLKTFEQWYVERYTLTDWWEVSESTRKLVREGEGYKVGYEAYNAGLREMQAMYDARAINNSKET